MAKSNNQKGKILYLERILLNTGENCTVSMQEILDRLAEKGVTAERKSIYDDLEVLRGFGMDIRYRRGKPGGYYLAGQPADLKAAREAARSEAVSGAEAEAALPEVASGTETEAALPEVVSGTEAEAASQEPVLSAEPAAVQPERTAQPESEEESGSGISEAVVQLPSWLDDAAGGKQIKLICENSVRRRVQECIGEKGVYKEKGMTMFTVTAEIAETPEFYGWLTAMGMSVRIQKPKKAALAYRDYLKSLAREYKGI